MLPLNPIIEAALISGICGMIGGTLVAVLNIVFPGFGFLLKRKIERTKTKEDLNLIAKTTELDQQLQAQGTGSLKIREILEDSLGPRLHRMVEFKMEQNIRTIADRALPLITDSDSGKIDPDWFYRFFAHAREISNADMQALWAKVLAGEVQNPGSFGIRTIDVLRSLTQTEAQLFQKVASFCFNNQYLIVADRANYFADYSVRYHEILELQEAGLLAHEVSNMTVDYDHALAMMYGGGLIQIRDPAPSGQKKRKTFTVLLLTSAGTQLMALVPPAANLQYLEKIRATFFSEMVIAAPHLVDK